MSTSWTPEINRTHPGAQWQRLLELERHRHLPQQLRRPQGQRLQLVRPRQPAGLQLLPAGAARQPPLLRHAAAARQGRPAAAGRQLRRHAILPTECAAPLSDTPHVRAKLQG